MTALLDNLHTETAMRAGDECIDHCLEHGDCLLCEFNDISLKHEEDCPLRPLWDAWNESVKRNAVGGSTTPPPPAPLTEPTIAHLDDEDDDVFAATSQRKDAPT